MFLNNYNHLLRPASFRDVEAVGDLLGRNSIVHRHLGWGTPLDLLGSQPYLVLEQGERILAALACPEHEAGMSWLQLFAAAPGIPLKRAWNALWPEALQILRKSHQNYQINALLIQPEIDELLIDAGFVLIDQVVVLAWDYDHSRWPEIPPGVSVRELKMEDLEQVCLIDRLAFELIWRNNLSQLETACQEAFSAAVIEFEGQVQAYQISTLNPQGGHLARLAVNPAFQSRGLGRALVADLLDRFQDRGILNITVNTQYQNRASLELYNQFGFSLLDERYPVRQFLI